MAKEKQKLHIHIGMTKTGSSSLQGYFRRNKEALINQGFMYINFLMPNKWWYRLERKLLYRSRLEQLLKEAPKHPHLIISNEWLSKTFKDPKRIELVQKTLGERFDVHIYAWFRRQDYWVESITAQRSRTGHPLQNQRLVARRRKAPTHYDYAHWIGLIEQVFPSKNIHIKIYRDDIKTNVVQDFVNILGIDASEFKQAERLNVSMSRRETLFLSRVSKIPLTTKDSVQNPMMEGKKIRDDGQRFILSPEQRRAVLLPYLEDNRRIGEQYDPDAADWFANTPEDGAWIPPEPISREEQLAVWKDCVAYQFRKRGRLLGLFGAIAISLRLARASMRPQRVPSPGPLELKKADN